MLKLMSAALDSAFAFLGMVTLIGTGVLYFSGHLHVIDFAGKFTIIIN